MGPTGGVRPLSPAVRWLFVAFCFTVGVAGIQLFVLAEQTDEFFAWTINPPLTAAFLGAAYWASFPLDLICARRRTWAAARIGMPGVLLFVVITLIVTLAHHDRFHFDSGDFTARAAAWAWLAVYLGVPIAGGIAIAHQLRIPGDDPPRERPLPRPLQAAIAIEGAILFAAGVALLVSPTGAGGLWPWDLSALTGRAVGAWLLGIGVVSAHALWEADLDRDLPAFAAYAGFGALELAALLRFHSTVDWGSPAAALLAGIYVTALLTGASGIVLARRPALAASAPSSRPPMPASAPGEAQ